MSGQTLRLKGIYTQLSQHRKSLSPNETLPCLPFSQFFSSSFIHTRATNKPNQTHQPNLPPDYLRFTICLCESIYKSTKAKRPTTNNRKSELVNYLASSIAAGGSCRIVREPHKCLLVPEANSCQQLHRWQMFLNLPIQCFNAFCMNQTTLIRQRIHLNMFCSLGQTTYREITRLDPLAGLLTGRLAG